MAQYIKDSQSNVVCGLGTLTYVVPADGLYEFSITSDITPGSELEIVINLNGDPVATSLTPSSAQTHMDLSARNIQCEEDDVVTYVLSSSVSVDQTLNGVKSILVAKQVG